MFLEEQKIVFCKLFCISHQLLRTLVAPLVSHRVRDKLLAQARLQQSNPQFAVLSHPEALIKASDAFQ